MRINHKPGQRSVTLGMVLLTIALSLAALCLGRYDLSVINVVKILLSPFFNWQPTWTEAMAKVVFQVRLPRVGAALLVGAGLSLSGTTYQGIFKNPLVSPDLLGVSSGACVGAALAILNGLAAGGVQVCALLGGLLAVAVTTSIPKVLRNSSALILVLAGVIVAGFMSSALGLLKYGRPGNPAAGNRFLANGQPGYHLPGGCAGRCACYAGQHGLVNSHALAD